jgi:hypothetical protein
MNTYTVLAVFGDDTEVDVIYKDYKNEAEVCGIGETT